MSVSGTGDREIPDGSGSGSIDIDLLHSGIDAANIPTLLLVLFQMTGEEKWLLPPYAPTRSRGLDDNDSGGLDEILQAEIRRSATDAILAFLGGAHPVIDQPDQALLARMLSVSMHEPVPEEYGEIIAADMGLAPAGPSAPVAVPPDFRILIIGAGITGICAAINARRLGMNALIIEKNEDFGGTWWENRYPGAGVDTPNHIYTFSFEKNAWSRFFALQGELLDYFRGVAERSGLRDSTRFNTGVEEAAWDEASSLWRVTVRNADGSSETLTADIVMSAVGILNVPQLPIIDGIDSFPGPVVHTARWPQGLEVTGKRVALVGNGASGMQVGPAIAPKVGHLTIFARSKQWAAPFPQFGKAVPEGVRCLIRTVPLYHEWYRSRLMWTFNDRIHGALQKDRSWPDPARSLNAKNDRHRQFFTDYIKEELGSRQDLLSKVLPTYPPYGTRILLDNGWYRTVSRDNVTLIDSHLKKVSGNRLTAQSGEESVADIIILATGFKATAFLASYSVRGRGGRLLRDAWEGDNARAYLGSTVPGFPNFFTLLGPNIGLGHGGSMIKVIEQQTRYAFDLVARMLQKGARTVDVDASIFEDYNRRIDEAHSKMVWTHEGTDNWYRNSRGRVVAITPWRNDDYWRMIRSIDDRDYHFGTA